MPYSFTKIEEDKSKTIGFVFFFLIVFYFLVFWLMALLITNYFRYEYKSTQDFTFSFLGFSHTMLVLILAFFVGLAHWYYTVDNLILKILGVLRAENLNPKDTYHQMFQNILDEVSVATGGKKITGVVLPTSAMNAFALADFDGRAIIGVTEGVLARSTRAQLEAIVGHEAAHIVSGDCLTTTVTTSLFGIYSAILNGLDSFFSGGRQSNRDSRAVVPLILIYVLLAATRFFSQLALMFVSREREYRADAIAVRLTRDPLSLAEALYAISYRWRGEGLPQDELEAIFIVNPQFSALDEEDGFVADLFSTHPPIRSRLKILLDMAHTDAKTLEQSVDQKSKRPRVEAPMSSPAAKTDWMINKDGAWQGPYDFNKIISFDWLKPETWIQRVGGNVQMAYQDPEVKSFFKSGAPKPLRVDCPRCKIPMTKVNYEGTEADKCSFCAGTLVVENDVQRIIIRQDVGFSEEVVRIAEVLRKEMTTWKVKPINRDPQTLWPCPKCFTINKSPMNRVFYTEAYRIEVDRCYSCQMIWFDKNELEVLQCLIEMQTKNAN